MITAQIEGTAVILGTIKTECLWHAWDFIVIIMYTVLLIIPHAASMNQFMVSGYVFWGVIGAMGIIMVIVITTATIIVVISLRKISKLSTTDQSTEKLEHDNRQSSF